MGEKEDAFFARLAATFRVEAEEHLQALSDGFLNLEKDLPQDERQSLLETVFREAHSLKGAARSVNELAIQEVCQALESVLAAWKQKTLSPSAKDFDSMHTTLDHLRTMLGKGSSNVDTSSAVHLLEAILQRVAPSASAELPDSTVTLSTVEPRIDQLMQRAAYEHPPATEKVVDLPPVEKPAPAFVQEKPEVPRDRTIRIALSKIDRLFQEAEEMLMVKQVTHQSNGELKKLKSAFQVREKELGRLVSDSRSWMQSLEGSMLASQDRKVGDRLLQTLEGYYQSLKKMEGHLDSLCQASQLNDYFVATMVDRLLDDVKTVLMQPISTLLEAIPRMVRDIAKELKKEIHLEFQGGEIEVDRRVLEEIKDPLIHLIRNAIDHGIEGSEERLQKGKSAEGTIRIYASERVGGKIELSVADDGRGFDVAKLKQIALKRSLISQKDVMQMSEAEALQLAFSSGISTSPIVTELSGRGLGLGIVSEKTDKLGGEVFIESTAGKGTTFRLRLPSTLATFRGIHLSVGNQDFILPAHNVQRVLRVDRESIQTIENQGTIVVDGHPVAFVHLSQILGIAEEAERDMQTALFALIVKAEEKTIAFGADAIYHEHEVLVKSLGTQCVRVKNIMAATIMEWGKVIPILNPVDLVRSAINSGTTEKKKLGSKQKKVEKKVVLIAEDSITTRLLLKNILESAGYEVLTAADGLEALEILGTQAEIDLLLTDVEMPRLDGFSLTAKARALPMRKDLPIIICTSRGSAEDREKGIEFGANAYLDKSSFSQGALLQAAKMLL